MDSLRAILQARRTARRDADGGFIRSRAFKQGFKKYLEFAPQVGLPTWVRGIDVSLWQAVINWPRAKEKGVQFAIIRAGSATSSTGECYKDTQFDRNSEQAPDHMVAVGYYWYFKPAANPIVQAEYFCNLIRDKRWRIWPVVDVEETGGKDKRGVASAVWVFCDRVKKALGHVMIYTSPGFWNSYVYPSDWAHKIPLWIAHWGVSQPWLPTDWSRYQTPWLFWQTHVGQDGFDHGMSSRGLDHNVFNGDLATFKATFGIGDGGGQPPAPALTHEQQHAVLWREAAAHGWNMEA